MRLTLRLSEEQRRGGIAMLVSAVLHVAMLYCALQLLSPLKSDSHASGSYPLPIQMMLIALTQSQPSPTSHAPDRASAITALAAPLKKPPPQLPKTSIVQTRPAQIEPIAQPGLASAPIDNAGNDPGTAAKISSANDSALSFQPSPAPVNAASALGSAGESTMRKAQPDYAYNPPPDYPLLLREQGVGGVVWLKVLVEADGCPGNIVLAKGSGYRLFDEAALRAVRHWRFFPARHGEKTLASWVEFPVRFSLQS